MGPYQNLGEERLHFTFEEFSDHFFFSLVTNKGNGFTTSEKCLISFCEIWVLLNKSMLGMWISICDGQCPFSFLNKTWYQVVVLVRNNKQTKINKQKNPKPKKTKTTTERKKKKRKEITEHLLSPGILEPIFILVNQENVIIESTVFRWRNSNPSLTSF